jgi:protease-4
MNKTLATLLTCVWLMDPVAAQAVIRDALDGKEIPTVDPHPPMAVGYDLSAQAATRLVTNYASGMAGYDASRMATVQVINIEDTLTPWYASWKADQLRYAYADESVLGVVIRMNCIGGADQAAYLLTDVLSERNKPVVVHCEYGQMNSSAYWTAAGCDYIMAGRATDRIGGIGIYVPFLDQSGYLKQQGYTFKDVYAPESTEKNAEFRAAQEGDFKPYEAYATEIQANFKTYVLEHRGTKLKLNEGDPFKGATYNATKALAIGLIDEIGHLERAVEKCIELAFAKGDDNSPQASAKLPTATLIPSPVAPQASAPQAVTPQATSFTTNTMFGAYMKMEALASLKGAAPEAVTPEKIMAVKAELQGALKAAGVPLALISEDEFLAGAQASEKVIALTNELSTAKSSVTTLTEERDKALEKAKEFGAQPGETPSNPTGGTDPAPVASGQPSAIDFIANLPSSRALDNNPLFN